MQHDRELIALVKAHMLLQTVAKKLDRPITTIIRRTARLGVSIERIAKAKEITSLSRWLDGLDIQDRGGLARIAFRGADSIRQQQSICGHTLEVMPILTSSLPGAPINGRHLLFARHTAISAILTLMGLVFDKVRFPGAYLPTSGFDMKELEKEIARIEAVPRDYDTVRLIGLLKFVKHVPTLQGFCEFQPDTNNMFSDGRFRKIPSYRCTIRSMALGLRVGPDDLFGSHVRG